MIVSCWFCLYLVKLKRYQIKFWPFFCPNRPMAAHKHYVFFYGQRLSSKIAIIKKFYKQWKGEGRSLSTFCLDKLQLTGQNLGQVFNSRSDRVYDIHSCWHWAKLPNLKLKTRPKQLSGSLLLDIWLLALSYLYEMYFYS